MPENDRVSPMLSRLFFSLDNYIQKMKKQYSDTRTSREAMGRLRTDLRDVQNIMVTNIQDVMSRGESLQGMCELWIG